MSRMDITPDSALVLVDVQNGFIGLHTHHIPPLLASFLASNATRFRLVIATRFVNTPGSQFVRLIDWSEMMDAPAIDLAPGISRFVDVTLDKHAYGDAPDIVRVLDAHHIRTVYMAGIDTDVCVLQNAGALFDLGYTVNVLYDLCASNGGENVHREMLVPLERTVGGRQVVRGVC